jgi:hypothetical protein
MKSEQIDVMICDTCNSEVPEVSKYCPFCGVNIPETEDVPIYKKVVAPWSRYFARWLDMWIGSSIFIGLLAIVYPEIFQIPNVVLVFILSAVYVILESFMLVIWGTTPGKYLLNIKLIPESQKKFTFNLAFNRSANVWIKGLGCGVSIISIITLIVAYKKLTEDKITTWDKQLAIDVVHGEVSPIKLIIIILLLLSFIASLFLFLSSYIL